MTDVHVLRVFVGPDGGGNPWASCSTGAPSSGRHGARPSQPPWASPGPCSWTAASGGCPSSRRGLPFAGHRPSAPAGCCGRSGGQVGPAPPAGEVATWQAGDRSWIRARRPGSAIYGRTSAHGRGRRADGPPPGQNSWAWIDEAAGLVRARYFFPDYGIGEDEATGAAAVMMGGLLGRPLEIRQGVGSVLLVRPGPDGTVEVGGRVEPVETRQLEAWRDA
jgi:hypothetical protein